jgi:hypothetical protein
MLGPGGTGTDRVPPDSEDGAAGVDGGAVEVVVDGRGDTARVVGAPGLALGCVGEEEHAAPTRATIASTRGNLGPLRLRTGSTGGEAILSTFK